MFIIIRTNSDKETKIAQAAKEFFQVLDPGMPVMVVPYGAEYCFITIEEDAEDGNQLIVIIQNESGDDLEIAKGFDEVAHCWNYARMVAKVAGFSEDNIDADVFDLPQCSN
ncbi:hypothetical protein P9E34_04060 [Schinkia azotoformans]|uniref:hypothetical protein n=1 Tax=Schinkia azotoformans TaxID=1454 RepID=UPI002DB73F5F|nr:hypothetical protein [Schinkia azotoformans]MEC1723920.1 hypothetical protein [Schinkia azotoformans]